MRAVLFQHAPDPSRETGSRARTPVPLLDDVLGATLAIFIAMNWGFRITLLSAAVVYLIGFAGLASATASSS